MRILAVKKNLPIREFTKALLYFLARYDYEKKLAGPLLKDYKECIPSIAPFCAQFKIPDTSVKPFLKVVNKTVKPTARYTESDETHVQHFCKDLQKKLRTILQNRQVSRNEFTLVKDWQLYLRKDSLPAKMRLDKNVGLLHDTNLNRIFVPELKEDRAALEEARKNANGALKKLTKDKLGPEGLDALTKEDRAAIKEAKPELYKKYLAHRRDLNKLSKKRLQAMVRNSGKPYLPTEEVRKKLVEEGYEPVVPKGFNGYVDDLGALYTTAGLKILGSPSQYSTVKMNPAYKPKQDNTYAFKAQAPGSPAGQMSKYYSVEFRRKATQDKYEKVGQLINNIENIMNKWHEDLMDDTNKKRQLMATIVETAYETVARIGARGNSTNGKPTYGLTTLQVKHVRPAGSGLRLRYKGKKGTAQDHLLKPENQYAKKAIQVIKSLIEGKDPSDLVFTYKGKPVLPYWVNNYLKSIGSPVTVHKIRTLRGTLLAEKLLKQNPFVNGSAKITDANALKFLKKQLTQVGRLLGHYSGEKVTPNTAIRSYIDPKVIFDYYGSLGIRPPATLEKLQVNKRK